MRTARTLQLQLAIRCSSSPAADTYTIGASGRVVAGSNHTQQYQGYYGSEMQCFAAVQGAQARVQGVNGATFRDGACYAEIGAAGVTSTNSSAAARVCMFTVAPESAVNVLREHHGYTGRP